MQTKLADFGLARRITVAASTMGGQHWSDSIWRLCEQRHTYPFQIEQIVDLCRVLFFNLLYSYYIVSVFGMFWWTWSKLSMYINVHQCTKQYKTCLFHFYPCHSLFRTKGSFHWTWPIALGTLRWAAPELLSGNRGPSFLGLTFDSSPTTSFLHGLVTRNRVKDMAIMRPWRLLTDQPSSFFSVVDLYLVSIVVALLAFDGCMLKPLSILPSIFRYWGQQPTCIAWVNWCISFWPIVDLILVRDTQFCLHGSGRNHQLFGLKPSIVWFSHMLGGRQVDLGGFGWIWHVRSHLLAHFPAKKWPWRPCDGRPPRSFSVRMPIRDHQRPGSGPFRFSENGNGWIDDGTPQIQHHQKRPWNTALFVFFSRLWSYWSVAYRWAVSSANVFFPSSQLPVLWSLKKCLTWFFLEQCESCSWKWNS